MKFAQFVVVGWLILAVSMGWTSFLPIAPPMVRGWLYGVATACMFAATKRRYDAWRFERAMRSLAAAGRCAPPLPVAPCACFGAEGPIRIVRGEPTDNKPVELEGDCLAISSPVVGSVACALAAGHRGSHEGRFAGGAIYCWYDEHDSTPHRLPRADS